MERSERESLAARLAEYIILNQLPEYGIYILMEESQLNGFQLSVAVNELSQLGLIVPQRAYLMADDASFSSFTLRNNALKNLEIYLNEHKKTAVARQLITLNAIRDQTNNPGELMKSIYQIVGSPYGFTDSDWDTVIEKKKDISTINIVLGYQFVSDHYISESLIRNLRDKLSKAVEDYNEINISAKIHLNFRDLHSGLGEHVFNEIARDILSADIAIFETSDLNPNVMIELGIALTCGVSVLPIRQENCPSPPSDISGQVWVKYRDSGANFLPEGQDTIRTLRDLITRVMKQKTRSRGAD